MNEDDVLKNAIREFDLVRKGIISKHGNVLFNLEHNIEFSSGYEKCLRTIGRRKPATANHRSEFKE